MPKSIKQKCRNCGSRTYKKHLDKPCCLTCKCKIKLMPEKLRKEFEEKWFK